MLYRDRFVKWDCEKFDVVEQDAYHVVDTMYGQLPQLEKDIFWDQEVIDLPVTQATQSYKKVNFQGSADGRLYDIYIPHTFVSFYIPWSRDLLCRMLTVIWFTGVSHFVHGVSAGWSFRHGFI